VRAGGQVFELRVRVGAPAADRTPPVPAPPVGIELENP
jgi:hypothetical protein